jgi:THO complex subunit 3
VELKHAGAVMQLSWNPADVYQLATCSADNTVKVWDVRSGECTQTFEAGDQVLNISWRPDGQQLGFGTKVDHISVYDMRATRLVKTIESKVEINQFQWDTQSERLFMTAANSIQVYNRNLELINELPGHTTNRFCIDVSSNFLVVGSADTVVSLWDVHELICMRGFGVVEGMVNSVSLSHDEEVLAVSSREAELSIIQRETGSLIQHFKTRRPVECVEWNPKVHLLALAEGSLDQQSHGLVHIMGLKKD